MQIVLDSDEAASKALLGLLGAQTLKMLQPKGGTLGATACLYPCSYTVHQFVSNSRLQSLFMAGWGTKTWEVVE